MSPWLFFYFREGIVSYLFQSRIASRFVSFSFVDSYKSDPPSLQESVARFLCWLKRRCRCADTYALTTAGKARR